MRRCIQYNEWGFLGWGFPGWGFPGWGFPGWGLLAGIPNAATVISCAHVCATKESGKAHKEAAQALAEGTLAKAHKEAAQALAKAHKEAAQALAGAHNEASLSLSIAIGFSALVYGGVAVWLGNARHAPR